MFNRKFKIENGQIVEKETGAPIPEDEPVFIFRASNIKALAPIVAYSLITNTLEVRQEIQKSINAFRIFQEKHPERMVEPKI